MSYKCQGCGKQQDHELRTDGNEQRLVNASPRRRVAEWSEDRQIKREVSLCPACDEKHEVPPMSPKRPKAKEPLDLTELGEFLLGESL